jgi:hypothetical protein
VRSTAVVATDAPARYAKQLLAHLGRKDAVETVGDDADGGRLVFGYGTGTVTAGEGALTLVADAPDAEGLAHVQDVLARHLERFGARRELIVNREDV